MADAALSVANLKARYCRAADMAAGDVAQAQEMMAHVFTDDFVGDYGYGPIKGPQAICDFLCRAIAGSSIWMVHMLGSPSIHIDGDYATGDWTIHVITKRRDGGQQEQIIGRYADTFRRTPDGWRIAHVVFSRLE